MNRYGQEAWETWRRLAPTALSEIANPIRHFSELAGNMIVRLQKTSQESCDGREARLAFGELRQSL